MEFGEQILNYVYVLNLQFYVIHPWILKPGDIIKIKPIFRNEFFRTKNFKLYSVDIITFFVFKLLLNICNTFYKKTQFLLMFFYKIKNRKQIINNSSSNIRLGENDIVIWSRFFLFYYSLYIYAYRQHGKIYSAIFWRIQTRIIIINITLIPFKCIPFKCIPFKCITFIFVFYYYM